MLVTIKFPSNGSINSIITQKYSHFYKRNVRGIRSPRARMILRMQLATEMHSVLSFHGKQVTYETDIHGSTFNPWKAHGWLVTFFNHWYFAGIISKDSAGNYYFEVKDAIYEGDYHNSPMPPCESKNKSNDRIILSESQLRSIIRESLIRTLYN